jgi:hypothetical protein
MTWLARSDSGQPQRDLYVKLTELVPRLRSYRKGWLIAPALVVSMTAQGGAALLFHLTRPEPVPALTLRFEGEGEGSVLITLAGQSTPLARCTDRCAVTIPAGVDFSLDAIPAEGATFGGFRAYPVRPPPSMVRFVGDPLAACTPPDVTAEEAPPADENADGAAAAADAAAADSDRGDADDDAPAVRRISDPLQCKTQLVTDTSIIVEFGKIPERVDVAILSDLEQLVVPAVPQPPAPPKPIDLEKLEADKPVEVALVPPQKMPQLPPPPPEEQQPPPPNKPPEPPPPNMTAVEVPDENEVKEAPDDAAFISDKNRDVAEETRAKETNLEKESKGKTAPSEESDDTTSPDVGGATAMIRQLEQTEATTDERVPETTHSGKSDEAKGVKVGEEGEGGDDGTGPTPDPGLLAMRGVGGRGSFTDRKMGDGKAQGKKGLPGVSTPLAFDDYERIIGKDKVEEERQVAARKMSMKKGRWEKKLAALQSALENFTPDIRTGNQTALKTRAQPFAVYLARMHRRIHELWGFGFLEFLDGKSSDHPLNDFDLFTDIEVAINPDGTVFKTTIAKTSGNLEFDVAALDTIMSGGPYEATPEVIRSVDQRVYLRWGFYRNWRQCGTFNAHPFILTEIPGGIVPIDAEPGTKAKPVMGNAPITPQDKASKSTAPVSPKTSVKDDKALFVANMWVSGFSQASVEKLVKHSTLPFAVNGQAAAQNRAELTDLYTGVIVESGPLKDWQLLTAEEYAAKAGAPAKLGEGELVLLVKAGKQQFAIVLRKTPGGDYRATQMVR